MRVKNSFTQQRSPLRMEKKIAQESKTSRSHEGRHRRLSITLTYLETFPFLHFGICSPVNDDSS